MRETAPSGAKPTVVVGLSSGVDSSVAALLLKNEGYRVIGVTFALAEPDGQERTASCCSPSLMAAAKSIADHLGIAHYAVDLMQEFRASVVDYFVSEYESGRTPNPCVKCNSRVRFAALLATASRLGADLAATGHYARLLGCDRRLARGIDPQKDQSYVLAEVDPSLLQKFLFPLGGLTKPEVRELAAAAGVKPLVSEESQEICFIADNDYRAYLSRRLGHRPGTIVDRLRNVVGTHTGTYNYTIGQRKGLGGLGGSPLYVTGVHSELSEVVVGSEQDGEVDVLRFSTAAVHRRSRPDKVSVQFRSMGRPVGGRLDGPETVRLDECVQGVAPGQTVVLYDGDDVLLGGVIEATARHCG